MSVKINHPAHQRHTAFTPACFAVPSGTAPRKRTPQQGRSNPHGTATSRTYVISPHSLPHTIEANISHDTTIHPAHQRHAAFTPPCFALPSGTVPRKRDSHQGRANPHGTAILRTYFRHTVCHRLKANTSESSSAKLFPVLHLYYKLGTPESSSEKLFPALHLYYKLGTSESSSEKLIPVLHLHYKLATSESSSEKLFPALHLHYKLATSESSSEKLFPALHLYYKLATSESSSKKLFPVLTTFVLQTGHF